MHEKQLQATFRRIVSRQYEKTPKGRDENREIVHSGKRERHLFLKSRHECFRYCRLLQIQMEREIKHNQVGRATNEQGNPGL